MGVDESNELRGGVAWDVGDDIAERKDGGDRHWRRRRGLEDLLVSCHDVKG